MTTVTEGYYRGEFVMSEANGTRSRETVTIASGAGVLAAGTVLGKITASGKYVLHDPVTPASDGSQNAAAILYGRTDATSADAPAVAIVRDAEIAKGALAWKSGATNTHKTNAYTALAALGVIARD